MGSAKNEQNIGDDEEEGARQARRDSIVVKIEERRTRLEVPLMRSRVGLGAAQV